MSNLPNGTSGTNIPLLRTHVIFTVRTIPASSGDVSDDLLQFTEEALAPVIAALSYQSQRGTCLIQLVRIRFLEQGTDIIPVLLTCPVVPGKNFESEQMTHASRRSAASSGFTVVAKGAPLRGNRHPPLPAL